MDAPRPWFADGFLYALIGGLYLAVLTILMAGLGDCPGEPTPKALACRATQQRMVVLYPVFYVAFAALALLCQRRGLGGAKALAIFAGPLAAVGVVLVDGVAK
jgi:hypothetical protein